MNWKKCFNLIPHSRISSSLNYDNIVLHLAQIIQHSNNGSRYIKWLAPLVLRNVEKQAVVQFRPTLGLTSIHILIFMPFDYLRDNIKR